MLKIAQRTFLEQKNSIEFSLAYRICDNLVAYDNEVAANQPISLASDDLNSEQEVSDLVVIVVIIVLLICLATVAILTTYYCYRQKRAKK